MLEDLKNQSHSKMSKAVDQFKDKSKKLRTGRAHTSLLDGIVVSYYGNESELAHIASISSPDARTIMISPWDQNALKSIEEALIKSSLEIAPQSDGKVIRLKVPELTEDRRKEIIRSFKKDLEQTRVQLRQIRKEVKDKIKSLLKDKSINEDDAKAAEDELQKQTDLFVKQVDEFGHQKEKELIQV